MAIGILIATAACPSAQAAWKAKAEAGYLLARGNASTDSANVKLDIARETDEWRHSIVLNGLYGTSNDIKSAERWDARWQTDYRFTERAFVFVAFRHEQDHFSGFDYQASATTGLGYEFHDTDRTQFTASLGAGYRRLRPEELLRDETGNVIQRIRGSRSEDVVANATVRYEHRLTGNTKLLDGLLVESGADNTLAQNELSVEVAMTERIALAVGYRLRHNTEPPPGLEHTERLMTLNLVYDFERP
jgi:putative salt-induced outer membrane protein